MSDFELLEDEIEEYNKTVQNAIRGLSTVSNFSSNDIVSKAHEIAKENILMLRDLCKV